MGAEEIRYHSGMSCTWTALRIWTCIYTGGAQNGLIIWHGSFSSRKALSQTGPDMNMYQDCFRARSIIIDI